jgi:NAD(P)H dehydrogenase (quinone)
MSMCRSMTGVTRHFVTMARLHSENRYDRMTHDVEAITGRPALTVRSYVESRADLFEKRA